MVAGSPPSPAPASRPRSAAPPQAAYRPAARGASRGGRCRTVFQHAAALLLLGANVGCAPSQSLSHRPKTDDADVVIYGATSAGVAAAVQTARMGKRAVLIEPGVHLGGLSAGGLGATDIGNKGA
ncbi:MAG TPA: FAD-dependent oxidoreductase, partial [Verrucomicrobiota bacterium]|nr:FAD-dependent oxidoreductase [Verrucomicrobiota bacterium]